MTCYMRHLGGLFELLGLEDDTVTRKRVDAAIREAFSLGAEEHCPEVWAAVKPLSAQVLADRLRGPLGMPDPDA